MLSIRTTGAYALEELETPIPTAGEGQVVVQISKVGICASDMQVYHGKHKYMTFPIIQGHEGIGIVHAVGAGVTRVKKGDKVNIQIQFSCGECYACKKGNPNVCVNLKGLGIREDGLFAEYFLCPEANINKVPDDFSDDMAMLIEPASVGVHSAKKGGIGPGDRAVVIGAGIIGNFTAQACRAYGAEVIIADVVDPKLDIARKNGLPNAINTKREDLSEAIGRCFSGREPTAVFDCAGVEASLRQAIAVASNASKIVIVANFKEPLLLEIPSLQRREITVFTVMASLREDVFDAMKLLHDGAMQTADIISARFPLRKMKDAYQYVDDNPATTMKVAIEVM